MGLFDKLKKNRQEEQREQKELKELKEQEVSVHGWDAINRECERIYPDQKNPKHYGTLIKWSLGGKDPLDGISIYDGGDCWHFVTYGMSELYEKESENQEISGFGMEFTFKLKKDDYEDEEAELTCICGILQTLARITFTQGELFGPYEYVYTGQTQGIDVNMRSNITGFITIPDKELQPIDTPNGRLVFVAFIGATDAELSAVHGKELTVKELYDRLGSDVTDYHRASVM